jgi:hypothetical protein
MHLWHGILYFFLKSLRILEEFRKNPCVKIPLKSSCANFQSLGKYKNLIFISKRNFFQLLAQSAQPPHRSARPFGPTSFLLPHRAEQSRHHRHRPCAASQRCPGLTRHGATALSATPHPTPVSPSPSFSPWSKTLVKSEPFHPQ